VRQALTGTVGLEPPLHDSLLAASRAGGARSGLGRQYRRHYLLMGCSDTLAVCAALLLAYQLRFDELLPPRHFWLLLAAVALLTPAVYLAMRLYRAHRFSTAEEFRRIIVAISLIVSATVMVSFWSPAPGSRLWMLLSWALGLLLALSVRRRVPSGRRIHSTTDSCSLAPRNPTSGL
jgi:FlaA1/EpsC-like NDP-sugar epimerase